MEKREARFKKITPVYLTLSWAVHLVLGCYYTARGLPYYAVLGFCGILFPLALRLVYKICRFRPIYQLDFLLTLFFFLLYTVGLDLRGYSVIPYYDKFAHTLTGVVFALIGLIVFYYLKPEKKISEKDLPLVCVFEICFSLAIAALWELSEFTVSLLFGTDPQNVLTTGVTDTMLDILVCLIGTLVVLIPVSFYFKKKRASLLLGIFDVMFHRNIVKEEESTGQQ